MAEAASRFTPINLQLETELADPEFRRAFLDEVAAQARRDVATRLFGQFLLQGTQRGRWAAEIIERVSLEEGWLTPEECGTGKGATQ